MTLVDSFTKNILLCNIASRIAWYIFFSLQSFLEFHKDDNVDGRLIIPQWGSSGKASNVHRRSYMTDFTVVCSWKSLSGGTEAISTSEGAASTSVPLILFVHILLFRDLPSFDDLNMLECLPILRFCPRVPQSPTYIKIHNIKLLYVCYVPSCVCKCSGTLAVISGWCLIIKYLRKCLLENRKWICTSKPIHGQVLFWLILSTNIIYLFCFVCSVSFCFVFCFAVFVFVLCFVLFLDLFCFALFFFVFIYFLFCFTLLCFVLFVSSYFETFESKLWCSSYCTCCYACSHSPIFSQSFPVLSLTYLSI